MPSEKKKSKHYEPRADEKDCFLWEVESRWDTPSFNLMSFVTLLLCVFLQGVDYGIVMPSLWLFMQKLDPSTTEVFLGVVLASFSAATAIFSPFAGMYLDKHAMKPAILVLTALSCLGSLIYGFATNVWMLLVGRIIAGLGALIFTASSLYVIRSTSLRDRSSLFAKVNMMFAIAMIVGPLINFPLSKMPTFPFGPFEFSALSSPGYVMAMLFVFSFFNVLIFFKEPRKPRERRKRNLKTGEIIEDEPKENANCLAEWLSIFSKFPCLVIFFTELLVIFNQTTIESILTPLTEMYYRFGQFENSILFAGMTVTIIIWLLAIGPLTQRFQDRTLLMTGHLMAGSSISLTVLFMAISNHRNGYIHLWQWALVSGIFVSSIPFYESVLGSLFSKLLNDPALNARGQSVMATSKAVGSILGPLVSGFVFPYGPVYVEGLMGMLWFLVYVLLVIAWSSMEVNAEAVLGGAETSEDDEAGDINGEDEGMQARRADKRHSASDSLDVIRTVKFPSYQASLSDAFESVDPNLVKKRKSVETLTSTTINQPVALDEDETPEGERRKLNPKLRVAVPNYV